MTKVSPGNRLDNARRRLKNASRYLTGAGAFARGGFHCCRMKSSSAGGGAMSWVACLAWGSEVTGCSVFSFSSGIMSNTADKSGRRSSPARPIHSIRYQRVGFFLDLALPGLGVLGVADLRRLGGFLALDEIGVRAEIGQALAHHVPYALEVVIGHHPDELLLHLGDDLIPLQHRPGADLNRVGAEEEELGRVESGLDSTHPGDRNPGNRARDLHHVAQRDRPDRLARIAARHGAPF